MNDGIISATRPSHIDEVIGLSHIITIIRYDIKGSILLKQPFPCYIVSGPSGTGKTTIAVVASKETGGNVIKIMGSDLKNADDVYKIAQKVKDGDVIVMEEAHTLPKKVQAILLEWMEHYKLLGIGDLGALDAPKVSMIFPTTDAGQLSHAFRNRCKILHTSFYSVGDLEKILCKAALKFNIDLTKDRDALTLLAKSSRGTPRTAVLDRLDMLRKVMVVDSLQYNLATVCHMLKLKKINEWGLEASDIKYCDILYKKLRDNKGRPVSKKILIQSCGLSENVIDNIIETYLQQIDIIKIESKGRTFTPKGYEVLDLEPVLNVTDSIQTGKNTYIDLEKLKSIVAVEENRKRGIKGIAPLLGLKYIIHNMIILEALNELGYTSKRRVGIVKIEE